MIGQQKNNRIPHNQNYHIIKKPVLVCSVTSVMSDSTDYSLPLFSTHWLLQAKIQWILLARILQATSPMSGLPCPPPGDLPSPGIEPLSLISPALPDRFFTTSVIREAG